MARFKKTVSFNTYNPSVAAMWDERLGEIEALYTIEGYAQPPTKETIFTDILESLIKGEVFKARIELSLHKVHILTRIPVQQLQTTREGKLKNMFEQSGADVWIPCDEERLMWYTERSLGQ